jgi:hypothetical protein
MTFAAAVATAQLFVLRKAHRYESFGFILDVESMDRLATGKENARLERNTTIQPIVAFGLPFSI